jgi:AmmeMemoRadiSam system protein A
MKRDAAAGLIPLEERRRLLALARGAIRAFAQMQRLPEGQSASLRQPGQRRGVFVSLHISGRLRGCIGRIDSPDSVESLVEVCAVLAASRDPRFPPVQIHELDMLEIELSILTPPEQLPASEVLGRLEPGVHGAAVSLGGSRGLLLPQVALQFGWSAQRFLEETCRKAGLPLQAWRDPEVRIELFTAEVFSEIEYPMGPAAPAH